MGGSDSPTMESINEMFRQLCLEEEKTIGELNDLLVHRDELESKVLNLQKQFPNFQLVQDDTNELVNMVIFTSALAENVSGKVRQLDMAKSRANDCMRRVEDILDVKFCTDGVQAALQNEDYEQAAAHIHRYQSLDESVLKMSYQHISEGSTLDTYFNVLHEAESMLKGLVTRKFDEAVCDGDVASVERFFKIFPLLNLQDEGLKKFSLYLCSQIAETAQKNLKEAVSGNPVNKRANVLFADTITLLFEGIARILEIQQPLIETYYGPGRLFTIVAILQNECDRQARKVIDEFKKQRQFQTKVNQVVSLTTHRSHEKLDPRDLDILLGETALINSRVELYIRFLRRRMINDVDVAYQDPSTKQERLQHVEKLIKDCELSCSVQELLGHYISMEEYFLRESVTKAITMDSVESESLTSSSVDDIFFIVKKCIRRSLSTACIDGVCATLNNACTVLEEIFLQAVRSHSAGGIPYSSLEFAQAFNVLQGKPQSVDQEKTKLIFLVSLNNLEAASEYTTTLRKLLEEEIGLQFSSTTRHEMEKLESCLSELTSMSDRFGSFINQGINEIMKSVLRPRVRPWVETFLSISHDLTEEEFENYEVNDPFIQNFIINIDLLLQSFKSKLSSGNFDKLVMILAGEVALQLEKVVLKSLFNRLGGLQFDKELRSLVGYLADTTTWSIRDKFIRLSQIATILNIDKAKDIFDYIGTHQGSSTSWRLTLSEVKHALSLRLDFSSEEIQKIKF